MLPHNQQQISNVHRSHSAHDKTIQSCLNASLLKEKFVRDVKAAPSPQSVLFFDCQLRDMERFLTDNHQFGVLTVGIHHL